MNGACFADLATAACFRVASTVQLAAVLGIALTFEWSAWVLLNLGVSVPASLAFWFIAPVLTRRLRDSVLRRQRSSALSDPRCDLLATGCVALAVFTVFQTLFLLLLWGLADAVEGSGELVAFRSFAPSAVGNLVGGVVLWLATPLLVRAFARDLGSRRAHG